MRTILVFAAACGLTVSAASAECVGHTASVDKEITTASVSKDQTKDQTTIQTDARSVKKEPPHFEGE